MTSPIVLVLAASCWGSLTATPREAGLAFHRPQDAQLEQSEVLFTTPDYTRKYGYPLETHTVSTEDGYLLTLHRIPGSPRAPSPGVKTPVFLQHGLASASDAWLLSGPEKALGFHLADQGYDVWLGNDRGNRYSHHHVTLSPKDIGFYNFTWHHIGVYDLPAEIDHVLKVTGRQQLLFVGHSMGCTSFFVMASSRPEYNHKIRFMAALAPAVFLGRLRSTLNLLVPFSNHIRRVYLNANEGQFRLAYLPTSRVINALCADGKPLQEVCATLYSAFFGFNRKELNTTLLPSILTHLMNGQTVQLLAHYSQLISTGRFQLFNFNNDRGGGEFTHQPEYDLSRVSTPVSIFYSSGDYIQSPEGVVKLSRRLGNLVQLVLHADERWNHVDFVWAIHAKDSVYPQLTGLLAKYNNMV